jgi:DNA-binding transcriptional regulator GbsR (MarR family)
MKNDNEKANYYMVIPAYVWNNSILTPTQKLLYGQLSVLWSLKGYCFATNDYLAKQLGVSKTTVSVGISTLVKLDFIIMKLIYKEGTKEVLERRIWKVDDYVIEAKKNSKSSSLNTPISENLNTPISENLNTPISENLKDNSTSINSIKDNTTEENVEKRFFVKGTTENDLFFKLQHKYPVNKRGAKKAVAKALSTLTIEEMNQAVANVERYLSLYQSREIYIVMLYNYIENRCFTEEWLVAEEKTQKQKTKSGNKAIHNTSVDLFKQSNDEFEQYKLKNKNV